MLAASLALVLASSVAFASTDLGADGQVARALRVLESSSSTAISGAKMQRYNQRRVLASLELQSQCL